MITKEKLDKITSNPESFVAFVEELKREIYLAIPEIVIKHIEDLTRNKKLVNDFYAKNPEMKENRHLVSALANTIAAENPQLSSEEVFNLTAIKAKKVLGDKDADKTSRLKQGKL